MISLTVLIRFVVVALLLMPTLAHAWKMEAGTLDLPATSGVNQLFSFSFKQTYATPPIVVALPTEAGPNASALRIDNVTTTGFRLAQVEPFSEDGPHTNMTVSYVAVERGSHTLPDGTRIDAGRLSSRDGKKNFVQFHKDGDGKTRWGKYKFADKFPGSPVIIGAIQTLANETNEVPDEVSEPWMTTVFDDVDEKGFNFALEFSEVFNSSDKKIDELPEVEQIGFISISATVSNTFTAIGNVNVRYEAQRINNGPMGWDDGCDTFGFNSTFGSSPIALASKTSRREDDGGWLRQCQLSASSIGLTIDEDDAQDSERSHGQESIGLVAFSQAFTFDSEVRPPAAEPLMLESRSVSLAPGSYTRVSFEQVYPSPPAVFVLSDDNNPEPSSARIRQVTEDGFEIAPMEPPRQSGDNADANTTIHYLAATYGQHQFPDGTQLEVGQVPLQTYQSKLLSGASWSRLNFLTAFGGTPAFISGIQTVENEASAPAGRSVPWLTMAHADLGASGIDLALDRAETTSGSISQPETVAYLAIEQGVIGTFVDNDGQSIDAEAQVTVDNLAGTVDCDAAAFLQTYASPPRVIGSQVTRDGGDGGWLRRCSVSSTEVQLKIEEDWANDQDRRHTTERASFLAFSDDFAVDFSLRAVYALEGPSWQGDPGEVRELRGTGLDGSAVAGASSEPAKVCYGVTLGGGSYINIPDDPELSVADELTVMAWINVASLPGGDGLKTIVSKDENYEYHVDNNGKLFWWWTNDSGTARSFTSGYQIPLDTWVHTAITYSKRDGVQRIVIDGVERARQTFADESLLTTADPFQIGSDQGLAGREFDGQIDEVRLYGRALSDAAILKEANRFRDCGQVLDHFRITVSATASVCKAADVDIQAEDAGDNPLVGYQGTVRLTTSAGHGNWQKVSAAGALTPDPDNDDDGQAVYQFVAADSGVVTLGLANTRADRLTIRAEDTSGGQFGVSGVVEFRENALVVSLDDALADDVIAGRPHGLQAEVLRRDPTDGECGRVLAYDGPIELRAWLDRQADHPPLAAAPMLNGGAGAVGLPSARPGATNLTVNFSEGLASLQLSPSDVGHFAIELEDSESGLIVDENGDPLTVLGSSVPLSVRPFGLALVVPGNPAGNSADGSSFQASGRPFDVQVRAVQYESADDSDADGQPDGHGDADATNNVDLNDNATTSNFDASVAIQGYLSAGPTGAVDPGLAGLSDVSGFSGGSVTGSAEYNEVGAIEVAADFVGSYLGRAITLRGDSGPVGRFHPESFSLESQMDGVLEDVCNGFNYTGQSFGYDLAPAFTLAARAYNDSGSGPITQNYRGSWQKLAVADFSRNDPSSDVNQVGTETSLLDVTTTAGVAILTPNGDGTLVYQPGADIFIYTRDANAQIAPFDAELELELTSIADSDGAAMPSAELPLLESTGASTRYGRLFLENTYGPETMDLKVPFEAQIWNGSRFERHTDENCWTYNTADAVITDTPPATSVDAETGTLTGGAPVSGAELLLEAPGEGNTGSVLVRYPVPSYWQDDFDGNGSVEDPTATVTFGVYRGHDRVIYWQER